MKSVQLFVLVAFLVGASFADMIVEQTVSSDLMPDKAKKGSTMTITIKGQKARVDLPDNKMSSIVDLQGNKMYTIDHRQKQVMVMSLDGLKKAADMSTPSGANQAKAEIKKTGKKEVIQGHSCEEYEILGTGANPATIYCWIAEDIDDTEMKVFRDFGGKMGGFFGMSDVQKPKGMVMRTESKMNLGGRPVASRSEVKNIKHSPVPDSFFVLPSDYKMMEMPKFDMPQKQPAK